jgi:VanZ like family
VAIVSVAALVWCALIVATSSTVIFPHDFFAWLAAHVLKDEADLRRFAAFWGYSWFAIVKGWHAAEFAILFVLVFAILDRYNRSGFGRNFALTSALCVLFAISDEYHQTFVPGRGGTWRDVAIDGLGVGLAGAFVWLRRRPPDLASKRTRSAATPSRQP